MLTTNLKPFYWIRPLMICCIALLGFAGYEVADTKYQQAISEEQKLRTRVETEAMAAGKAIEEKMRSLMQTGEAIASRLEQGRLEDTEIRSLIANTMMASQEANRGGVVFRPYRFDNNIRLYSPYYQAGRANSRNQMLSDRYDYTLPDSLIPGNPRTFWYHQPLEKGPMWLEPYFGQAAQTWLAEYIYPFRSPYYGGENDGYDGLIFLNFSLRGLRDIVAKLALGPSGFAFIVSEQGNFLSYPDPALLGQNIRHITDPTPLQRVIQHQFGHPGPFRFTHPVSGKESWLFFHDIPGSQNQLGILVASDEFSTPSAWLNHADTLLLLLSLGLAVCTVTLVCYQPGQVRYWILLSVCLSLSMLAALMFLWMEKSSVGDYRADQRRSSLVDQESLLTQLLAKRDADGGAALSHPVEIGLDISSLEFINAKTVQLAGIIWQTRPDSLMASNSLGGASEPLFSLPDGQSLKLDSLFDDGRTQVWQLNVNLELPFDYSSYPFDIEDIELRIWPRPEGQPLVLLPALSDYSDLAPSTLPGLALVRLLGGWLPQDSFFVFSPHPLGEHYFNTFPKWGLNYPQLSFHIVVKREVTGPVITHVMPLLVVAFLIFCVLLLWNNNDDDRGLWNFRTQVILPYCASLFFILVLAHVSLRDELQAKGVIYLEYLYFIIYAIIVLTALTAVLYSKPRPIPLIDYRDNLVYKLCYWPLIFTSAVIVTLVEFW